MLQTVTRKSRTVSPSQSIIEFATRRRLIGRPTIGIRQLLVIAMIACVFNQFRGHPVIVQDGNTREMRVIRQMRPDGLDLGYYYRSLEELEGRSQRFPSVEKRLKVYMSTWYVPPCPDNNEGLIQYNYIQPRDNETSSLNTVAIREPVGTDKVAQPALAIKREIEYERRPFVMDRGLISTCKRKLCRDAVKYYFASLDRVAAGLPEDDIPTILQFGDSEQYRAYAPSLGHDISRPIIPVIKKFRFSMDEKDLDRVTSQQCYSGPRELTGTARDPQPRGQAIVSIVFNHERHFHPMNHVPAVDTPWEKKLNAAVYRGALTGRSRATAQLRAHSELEWCRKVPRCNFVLLHGRSTLVDARLVSLKNRDDHLSKSLNDVDMFGQSLSMGQMLQYKAIVMLEGNDVSSGLKWALFSESVVMMQTPTCTSWALEELLEPWVHYIPLADDFSDVEEKVQWVIDNDAKAREIAQRGRLWMADLVFHPDATKDNELVLDETFRRYKAHFIHNPELKLEESKSMTTILA